ncbi:transcription factor bHLH121-like isoform X2 [Aristolochia californica]|uniref:transcription factor bHLH121-like isoform X2 n=1 Tax=Aristolochia californica TaxID=171875 RepID=UPI0035D57C5B
MDAEVKDTVAARKVQKADREKLRRDKLNEQFLDLGHALDPERPRNDKVTILTDAIQELKDLTAQVNRLKAEYASLSEESRELTQEKNELREEKAALKSDIENLNVQYQQRLGVMYPWSMDPSVVMAPPSYPYPVAVRVPPGPIPMHPSLQPYPFFPAQNPGAFPNPCSTFLQYSSSPGNPQMEPPSVQHICPHSQLTSRSHSSSKQDSRSKSSDRQRGSNAAKADDSDDVETELELKTPGSCHPSSHSLLMQEQLTCDKRKGKQCRQASKESGNPEVSYSSKGSSSRIPQDNSSASAEDGSITNH